ncbi:MAG TPA: sigma-70 family RNA polymerase sigma factor [Actinomycetota bacterium]|nr:sigma-70 family RNA polymerase sigma factor [Actinomycetota bacterium]
MDVPTEVIEACQQGRSEAFEELVRLTQRDVYTLALRLTGNPDDAADVTQEVYIRLLRSIRTFRGEAKFSTWLYRVTSSVAITALRKRARRRHEVSLDEQRWEDWKGSASEEPGPELDRRELAQHLEAALATLPEGYRSVVVLRDVYGMSLAEVGEQVGISEGAAKVRLFRARQKLMELLKDEETEAPRADRRKRRAAQGVAKGVRAGHGRESSNGMS